MERVVTFTDTEMTEFVGSVRCQATERSMFTGVALEMDFNNGIFTTLPIVPVNRESALDPDVPVSNVVVAGSGNWGDDPYVVNSAGVAGHRLTVEISYGGGCRRHIFTLVISKSFTESDPVQLPAVLAHDANGDPCEAWLTTSHVFDLALVRTRYRQSYGPGPGRVVLRIEGVPRKDLVYEFAE